MKVLKYLIVALILLFTISGCGGGGSSLPTDSETIIKGADAKITEDNLMLVLQSANSLDNLLNKDPIEADFRVSNKKYLNARVQSENCLDGGSVSYDDSTKIAQYKSCKQNGYELNGEIKIISENKIELKNFYIKSDKFTMYYSKVESFNDGNSEDTYIKSAYIKTDDDYMEIVDYRLKTNYETSNISGYYSSSKYLDDKWVKLTTKKDIVVDGDCPKDGIFEISANSNVVKIEYKSNHNVNLYFNNKLINTYANCNVFENSIKLFTPNRVNIDIQKDKLLTITKDNTEKVAAVANIFYGTGLNSYEISTNFETFGGLIYNAIDNCYGSVENNKLYELNSCHYNDATLNGRVIFNSSDDEDDLNFMAVDLNISSNSNNYTFYKDLNYNYNLYVDEDSDEITQQINSKGIAKYNGSAIKFITNITNANKDISLAPECLGFNWYDVKPSINDSEGTIDFKYVGESDTKGYYSIGDESDYIIYDGEILKTFDSIDDANDYFYQILTSCSN